MKRDRGARCAGASGGEVDAHEVDHGAVRLDDRRAEPPESGTDGVEVVALDDEPPARAAERRPPAPLRRTGVQPHRRAFAAVLQRRRDVDAVVVALSAVQRLQQLGRQDDENAVEHGARARARVRVEEGDEDRGGAYAGGIDVALVARDRHGVVHGDAPRRRISTQARSRRIGARRGERPVAEDPHPDARGRRRFAATRPPGKDRAMDVGDLRRGVARGLASGIVGTTAMTAWQELSARLFSGDGDGTGGDSLPPARVDDRWAQAPAPARVARLMSLRLLQRDIPVERIGLTTNVMHWAYGVGWGKVYGLVTERSRPAALPGGLAFGAAVWALSYATLVPLRIYEPPWRYSPQVLAEDLSYHLAYGTGVGIGDAL